MGDAGIRGIIGMSALTLEEQRLHHAHGVAKH